MTERSEDPREALLCDGCSALAADEVRREKGRGYAFDNYTEYIIRHPDGEHLFVRAALAQAAPPPSLVQVQGDTAGGGTPLDDDYEDGIRLAQAAPPRSDDLETVCHAILGGTSYLPHREAAQRLLAQAAPPPETETMTLQRGPNWTDSHSGTTHKTWLPAQAAPPSGLDVDDETLAVALHEANVAGVDDYPSWVAYARDILRVLAALRSPR